MNPQTNYKLKILKAPTDFDVLEEIKVFLRQEVIKIEQDEEINEDENAPYDDWETGRIAGTQNVINGLTKIIYQKK